jgi:hypothetical protein
MLRILLIAGGVLGLLSLLLALNVLPPPLDAIAAWIVSATMSLACPLFLCLMFFMPGLFQQLTNELNYYWNRFRTRRNEIDDLRRRIAHLNKPHHMAQLGTVYLQQGRFRQASDWFQQALERDGESLDARYKLALCRFSLGDYATSAELLEQVHQVRPDHDYGMAYLRLAQSHHFRGNLDRAREVYELLLRFYPGHPEGSYHYALLTARQGDVATARQRMNDVIFTVRHAPGFQRRRNRHWSLKARWWLFRNGSGSVESGGPGAKGLLGGDASGAAASTGGGSQGSGSAGGRSSSSAAGSAQNGSSAAQQVAASQPKDNP